MIRGLAILSLVTALAGFPAAAAVSPKTEPANVTWLRDLQKAREKIESQELKRRKVLSALFELNNKIRRTVGEKSKLEQERETLQAGVAEMSAKIDLLEQETDRMRSRLAERLKALSRLGGASLARIMLSASNASQLDRNLKILGLIATKDRELIHSYLKLQKDVKGKRTKLAGRLAMLQKLEQTLLSREGRLLDEQKMKRKILDGIRKQKLFAQKSVEELRQQGAQMGDESLLDGLFRPSFIDQKGLLDAPVIGRWHEVHTGLTEEGVHLSSKGLFIETASRQPVKAVFDGRVAFIGDMDGWGPVTVLDHGDHYYSVYAGAGGAPLSNGQEIRRGQLIGHSARSEFQGRHGVYFEIRYFSEPSQPRQWLKGSL